MQKYSNRFIVILLILLAITTTSFSQDNMVLVWTTFDGAELEWLNAKVTEFNDTQTDFAIDVQVFADDAQMLATYNNNEGIEPALLHLQDDTTQAALDLQFTQPFEDVVGDAESILDVPVHQGDWFDTVTAHASFNGAWTTIPVSMSTAVMYVNTDLLTEAGSSMAFVPQDIMTLEMICDELASAIDDGTIDACITWDDTGWLYEHWLAQLNTSLVNNNNGREFRATTFDLLSDASISTLEFMRRMMEVGYAQVGGEEDAESVQLFVDGHVPILIADNTIFVDTDFTFAIDLLASNSDFGWSGARLDTENLWLSARVDSEVAETAVAFSLFLTSPENNVEWYQATGSLPLSQTAYELVLDSEWVESNPEQLNVFRALTESVADSATLYAVFGDSEAIRDSLNFGLNQIIASDVDIAQGLQTTQDFVIEQLETYNLTNAPDID